MIACCCGLWITVGGLRRLGMGWGTGWLVCGSGFRCSGGRLSLVLMLGAATLWRRCCLFRRLRLVGGWIRLIGLTWVILMILVTLVTGPIASTISTSIISARSCDVEPDQIGRAHV